MKINFFSGNYLFDYLLICILNQLLEHKINDATHRIIRIALGNLDGAITLEQVCSYILLDFLLNCNLLLIFEYIKKFFFSFVFIKLELIE